MVRCNYKCDPPHSDQGIVFFLMVTCDLVINPTVYLHFCFVLCFESGFLCPGTHSVSASLCLLRSGIKSVRYHCPATLISYLHSSVSLSPFSQPHSITPQPSDLELSLSAVCPKSRPASSFVGLKGRRFWPSAQR